MAAAPPVAAQADPNRVAAGDAANGFQNWLAGFRAKAVSAGISAEIVDRELAGLTYNPTVVRLDRQQPVNRVTDDPILPGYLARRLTPTRIDPGRRLALSLNDVLVRAEAETGVDGDIILGIWGMETNYGGYTGDFDAVRSLATLAFDGRREGLFTRELIAALEMIDRGLARRGQMVGSWAGALGNPQFLPTSYLKHAVDYDGDTKANIWGSRADTIGSIANYLKEYGWVPGVPWGVKVSLPSGFDRDAVRALTPPTECTRVYAKHSRMLPVSEWKAMGIGIADPKGFPSDDVLASLVEVDGPGTDAYLATQNYRALLGYNCSNYYAISVGTLGDIVGTSRP
ncbi:lytic murein transglycosylase [Pacificimonas sp. WHA3]|uniref:Lytic murein transglycosylase n=2 Tax=Pacificimonas pallii TaxID=2827236 RepID=A0ABS6SEW7_9SPHN|nr:lytic murein transglycosylase [Pacificimonas pallii]